MVKPVQSLTIRYVATAALILALLVVMLGAYTRLTNAGLGCPDWPGCYGHLVLPRAETSLIIAQQQYPAIPIESGKAWTEMAHRYAAGTLGLLILTIALYSCVRRLRGLKTVWRLPLVLLALVFFQAVLGMWTVTMKLLPVVVMSHLLGGVIIFSCLARLRLQYSTISPVNLPKWRPWIGLGIGIVLVQIALGGWVSSNYAGIACIGFPQCNGQWLPALHFSQGFNLFSPIGANYQGGVLDNEARVTIQYIHRIAAVITASYLLALMTMILLHVREKRIVILAFTAIALLSMQFMLGLMNVIYLLPLWVAVSHNGVAALLLAVLFMMFYLIQGNHHELR